MRASQNVIDGCKQSDVIATHTSCTVEMVDVHTKGRDVGVIDEIQLIGDEQRGWAWSRAFDGLEVRCVHGVHAMVVMSQRCTSSPSFVSHALA